MNEINIKVGDRINGKKIVEITKDYTVLNQINLFTDEDKVTAFGDRETICFRVKKGD